MTIKVTQFSYDGDWGERKSKIKGTWRDVMEAGIIALEQQQGVAGGSSTSTEQVPQPNLESENKPEKPKGPEQYYLQLDVPHNVMKREFDVLKNWAGKDGKPQSGWSPSPFDEIDIGSIFRVRDDAVILCLNDHKRFKKVGLANVRDGRTVVLVELEIPEKKNVKAMV